MNEIVALAEKLGIVTSPATLILGLVIRWLLEERRSNLEDLAAAEHRERALLRKIAALEPEDPPPRERLPSQR